VPIRAISPNSTWLVTSRLDTFDVSSPCILVVAAAHYVIIISIITVRVTPFTGDWKWAYTIISLPFNCNILFY